MANSQPGTDETSAGLTNARSEIRGVGLSDATRGQYEAVGARSAAENIGGGTASTRESDAS